jgi:dienelactone hydrolase
MSDSDAGVVVIQEWWGLIDHITRTCDRIAEEGIVGLLGALRGPLWPSAGLSVGFEASTYHGGHPMPITPLPPISSPEDIQQVALKVNELIRAIESLQTRVADLEEIDATDI